MAYGGGGGRGRGGKGKTAKRGGTRAGTARRETRTVASYMPGGSRNRGGTRTGTAGRRR